MYVKLDFESSEPIYTQLKQEIIEGIAKGELIPGERLPSVREFAADIGINLHTVNKAYQHLRQEGFIQIHRQKGVVINPDGVPQADDAYRQQLQDSLRPLIAEAVCKGIGQDEWLDYCRDLFREMKGKGDEK